MIKKLFPLSVILLGLVACGGGGGSSAPTSPADPTPPDPTPPINPAPPTDPTPPPVQNVPVLVHAINAGGHDIIGPDGIRYFADHRFTGGRAQVISQGISTTATERLGDTTYVLPAQLADFELSLVFTESAFNAAGQRVFDISVAGDTLRTGFDIYQQAGAANTPVTVTTTGQLSQPSLTVSLVATQDSASLSALRLTQMLPADQDHDSDGVLNSSDTCGLTPAGETVDANGCSRSQLDADSDGIADAVDLCATTPANQPVAYNGCVDGVVIMDEAPFIPAFIEKNGVVAVEMESLDIEGTQWITVDDAAAMGGKAIEWNGDDLFSTPGQGVIDVYVEITNPGVYLFSWANQVAEGDSTTEANDSWLRINADRFFGEKDDGSIVCPKGQDSGTNSCVGELPEGAGSAGWFKAYRFGGPVRSYLWATATSDRDPHPIFAEFSDAGVYKIEIAGRSKHHRIDRFTLVKNDLDDVAQRTAPQSEQKQNPNDIAFVVGDETQAQVTGELKTWHKITLAFDGPDTHEAAVPNPFTDYRLDVTFTQGSTRYTVPGYYAADGDAADSSATSGNQWHVNFSPDNAGVWQYRVSFKHGLGVALSTGGDSAGFMDGASGSFTVAESDKQGRDFRALGRAEYVGQRYLKHRDSGDYLLKCGADSPENAFAYADFDATQGIHDWREHEQDFNITDASAYTWASDGLGQGLLGAVAYLADTGCNAMSFLTYSAGGSVGFVTPHLSNVMPSPSSLTDVDRTRFDVSKLAQWEQVMQYADQRGVFLHFKTFQRDNVAEFTTAQRQLYYRELVARFAHHLALNWNLSEELMLWDGEAGVQQIAAYLNQLDPYDHLIVFNSSVDDTVAYGSFLGAQSALSGASLQLTPSTANARITDLSAMAAAQGKPWVISYDQQAPATTGIDVDLLDVDTVRQQILWASLMAGGAGVEYYYGTETTCTDTNCDDHRTRMAKYQQAAVALAIMHLHLPFEDMQPANTLTATENDYVLRQQDEMFAVYLPDAAATDISLPSGSFQVQWFNPIDGEPAGGAAALVDMRLTPPNQNQDWLAIVIKTD